MNFLGFKRESEVIDGRRIRRARFERRSSLPVSAACVVANSVRETLGAVLGAPVSLRLLEPLVPDARAWNAICTQAQIFGVRGPLADAALILRPRDALALAAAAFGEDACDERALSPVENEVLARALRSISGSLTPVCGRELSPLERILDIRGYAAYFEIIFERPIVARLGVALSRDPVLSGGPGLRIEDLRDVEVEVAVEFARGLIDGADLLALRPGANVPMMTRVGEPALLTAAGSVLARGECGALGERNVLIVKGT